MHNVRPSRSRILFDTLCALVVSVSFVGAWMQTGASALLPAAAASVLYALVRAFDRTRQAAADQQSDSLMPQDAVVPLVADTPQQPIERGASKAEPGELATSGAKASRRTKAPRKSGGNRAKPAKEPVVTELTPSKDSEVPAVHLEVADADASIAPEEVAHLHIETLFEPEPFVRMARPAFGRKAG